MAATINIRRAEKEDCPRLMELINELAVFEKSSKEVVNTSEQLAATGFCETPAWHGFVAETDGQIHGFALYYVRYSTWKGPRLYLEDLIVTEEKRGLGIGKLLFEELLKEAKEKKYSGMVWQVLDWNETAIEFYKKYNTVFDRGWLNCSIEIK